MQTIIGTVVRVTALVNDRYKVWLTGSQYPVVCKVYANSIPTMGARIEFIGTIKGKNLIATDYRFL